MAMDSDQVHVHASNARATSTGASYRDVPGTDVDVTVTLPSGETVTGEVTLLPRADGRPGLTAWGSPDNWVSGRLLSAIYAACGDGYRTALDEIEAAAATAATSR